MAAGDRPKNRPDVGKGARPGSSHADVRRREGSLKASLAGRTIGQKMMDRVATGFARGNKGLERRALRNRMLENKRNEKFETLRPGRQERLLRKQVGARSDMRNRMLDNVASQKHAERSVDSRLRIMDGNAPRKEKLSDIIL